MQRKGEEILHHQRKVITLSAFSIFLNLFFFSQLSLSLPPSLFHSLTFILSLVPFILACFASLNIPKLNFSFSHFLPLSLLLTHLPFLSSSYTVPLVMVWAFVGTTFGSGKNFIIGHYHKFQSNSIFLYNIENILIVKRNEA